MEREPIFYQIKKEEIWSFVSGPVFRGFWKRNGDNKEEETQWMFQQKRVNSNKKHFYKFSLSGFRPRY